MATITKDIIKIKPWRQPTGHQAHVGGNGVHHDKRTQRVRTRRDANRAAIKASCE